MCNGLNCPYENTIGRCTKTDYQLRNEPCPHEIEADRLAEWKYDTAMEHKRDERNNR